MIEYVEPLFNDFVRKEIEGYDLRLTDPGLKDTETLSHLEIREKGKDEVVATVFPDSVMVFNKTIETRLEELSEEFESKNNLEEKISFSYRYLTRGTSVIAES